MSKMKPARRLVDLHKESVSWWSVEMRGHSSLTRSDQMQRFTCTTHNPLLYRQCAILHLQCYERQLRTVWSIIAGRERQRCWYGRTAFESLSTKSNVQRRTRTGQFSWFQLFLVNEFGRCHGSISCVSYELCRFRPFCIAPAQWIAFPRIVLLEFSKLSASQTVRSPRYWNWNKPIRFIFWGTWNIICS